MRDLLDIASATIFVTLVALGVSWHDEVSDWKYVKSAVDKEFTPTVQSTGEIFTFKGRLYIKSGDKIYICKDPES